MPEARALYTFIRLSPDMRFMEVRQGLPHAVAMSPHLREISTQTVLAEDTSWLSVMLTNPEMRRYSIKWGAKAALAHDSTVSPAWEFTRAAAV